MRAGEIHIDRFVKAKVSEGQWIIGGHEKLRGIELFMPLLKDTLLILQSSLPTVITIQIVFFSSQRRFQIPLR